jgi:lipoprotein-anchoring transpeptidase ErfK/SrfK
MNTHAKPAAIEAVKTTLIRTKQTQTQQAQPIQIRAKKQIRAERTAASLGGSLAMAAAAIFLLPAPAGAQGYYYPYSYYAPYSPYPAYAPPRHAPRHQARKRHDDEEADVHVGKEPFGKIPPGQLQIFVSIDQQKLHLYSDGVHVADTSIATGVPSLPTPLGVFSVIEKERFHRSNLYSNAPMPFMQRITWSGVALHEGENIGHPASHGCIRMPREFAAKLYGLTKVGARVVIARNELSPAPFADPHLFVHKEQQVAQAPAPGEPVKTADRTAGSSASDASLNDVGVKPADAKLSEGKVSDGKASGDKASDGSASDPKASDGKTADVAAAAEPPATATPPGASEPSSNATPAPAPGKTDAAASPPAKPADSASKDAAKDGTKDSKETAKEIARRTAPIAIFVSRRDKRIYVRQNFRPLFDAPVTIADADQPLGTQLFTALDYLPDHETLRWNVVTLPAERVVVSEKRSRHRGETTERTVTTATPDTPDHALARIDIPQDVRDRIEALIVPGSSLIVSDHGLGEETGEGTDFIVVTR